MCAVPCSARFNGFFGTLRKGELCCRAFAIACKVLTSVCVSCQVTAMPAGARWINTVDPLAYALNALLPLHLTCNGGPEAGCPTISYPLPDGGVSSIDRTKLVDDLYDVSYSRLWSSIAILSSFAGVLLVTTALSMAYVRHITR